MSKSKKSQETRLRRLSLAPISPEDALRGAMKVPPPADPKLKRKKKAAKKKRKKGKKRMQ